jgi:hypothetical protein
MCVAPKNGPPADEPDHGENMREFGPRIDLTLSQKVRVTTTNQYPSRIEAFRSSMIDDLPRVPNNRASRALLEAMPTRRVILAFLNWRSRRIPSKQRTVSLWSGGVTPLHFQAAKSKLRSLLQKVEAGEDVTPHLSDLVRTKGIILPGASPTVRGQDVDMILTRYGLHHFHVGHFSASNPKGRSGSLVFAEVLDKEFRIIAIADHHVFTLGSAEQFRFSGICHAYIAKAFSPGTAFMLNPVTSSGHSVIVSMFAVKCEDEINRLDPLLDDPAFIDSLYNGQPILRDGLIVARPANPSLAWHFDDLEFGILDKQTMVFFSIFPFFARQK